MSEKRYFKIFSERHTIGDQNKYVTLFQILESTESESDEYIKQQLRSKKINSDFLSADKNYLYNLVLKSLNDFHDSKTFNLELKEMLCSIEILFHKGLYRECLKLITRAEQVANDCENIQLLIDVLMWKKKCCGYSIGINAATEVNKIIGEKIESLNLLKHITDLYYESNLINANNEKGAGKDITRKFKKILNKLELLFKGSELPYTTRIYYHLIYSNYYFTIDNKTKELNHLQNLVNLLSSSKSYAIENPLDYISIYNRLLSIKKYFPESDFFENIATLQEFGSKVHIRKDVIIQRVLIYTNTHELEYYLINNLFQKALSKTKEIENNISKLDLDIEPYHIIYFYYLQIITQIFTGQFNKALKYVNKILNEFTLEARPQVFMRVELLNIIVHYELKNYSLLISLTKSLLKKNIANKILVPFEEKILRTFIKIVGAEHFTLKEETAAFQSLLDPKDNDNVQFNSLINNCNKWLHSKIKRKLVSEIYH